MIEVSLYYRDSESSSHIPLLVRKPGHFLLILVIFVAFSPNLSNVCHQSVVLMNQFLHPVLQSLILKQFLARRSQNTNFNLIRRAGGTTSHVIVREDFDETVELGLSGGLRRSTKSS